MNTYICSTNEETSERLESILLSNEISHQIFTSLENLLSCLSDSPVVNIIYHLCTDEFSESELSAIQEQYKEKVNVLVLSNMPDSREGVRLLNKNVRGYANTWLAEEKLIVALSVIEQGEIWAGAILMDYLLQKSTEQHIVNGTGQGLHESMDSVLFNELSEREQEIAQHIYTGQKNKDIAAELYISERTVKAHLSNIYKKMKVRNRLELSLKLVHKNNKNPDKQIA
ncbi:MAG: response regulator transcription factor [Thiotrichaceae bacterium]|nr:response regulator transcription factor [Thiotrichaceae bacterium]